MAVGRRAFEQQQQQIDAGLDLPDGVPELARRAGVDLRDAARARRSAVDSAQCRGRAATRCRSNVGAIPVKKGMLDFVAFRSLDRARADVRPPRERPTARSRDGEGLAARRGRSPASAPVRGAVPLPPDAAHVRGAAAFFGASCTPRRRRGSARRLAYGPGLRNAARAHDRARGARGVHVPLRARHDFVEELQQKLQALRHDFDRNEQQEKAGERTVVLEPRAGEAKGSGTRDQRQGGTPRKAARPGS